MAFPILLAASPLGDPAFALRGLPVPDPHSVDIWGHHTPGVDIDLAEARADVRRRLVSHQLLGIAEAQNPGTNFAPASGASSQATSSLGGFTLVGSVAVISADESMVTRRDAGYGLTRSNLAALSTRFLKTFGDDYDQLAVFLAFPDRNSTASLAYQQPVKNDVRGLGLGLFDLTGEFGSPSGRMQTVLNMKRANLYGRDAAGDPDNGLYPVWAQEAAHRWLVYFRYQRANETMPSTALLGRQDAHWSRGVEAQGSIMDGYDWKDNGDGTFTPGRRAFRYGVLDQYGMGLRKASEVPPFFLLEDIKDLAGNPAPVIAAGGRYQAKKIDLTIEDIIRGTGAREPEIDAAAQELRMGVILLGPPETRAEQLIGEAFQIDNTRRLWTAFYDAAGGGRGKVCTELLRPCRGDAFSLEGVALKESPAVTTPDGTVAPGERFELEVQVTNIGDKAAAPTLTGRAAGLAFDPPVASGSFAPLESRVVKLSGRVEPTASCDQLLSLDLRIAGSRGGSRTLRDVTLGIKPSRLEGFEGVAAPDGWRINPEGNDTGQVGRWAWGTPKRTVAFDYTLQPGAAFSGEGAFATGLSDDQVDNVEGRTTLESPAFALDGLREPTVSYEVYFVAAGFAQEVLVPVTTGSLQILASVDGTTWAEIDRVTGMATGWQRRVVRLRDKLGAQMPTTGGVRLRFVAEELQQGAARPVVEVAIDDVGIYDQADSCGQAVVTPDAGVADGAVDGGQGGDGEGCACALGAASRESSGLGLLAPVVGAAWLAVIRRQRTRRSGPSARPCGSRPS
ncbi:MAG TPA: hypothetical protein VGG33_01120 [Polyangia bacterium]